MDRGDISALRVSLRIPRVIQRKEPGADCPLVGLRTAHLHLWMKGELRLEILRSFPCRFRTSSRLVEKKALKLEQYGRLGGTVYLGRHQTQQRQLFACRL